MKAAVALLIFVGALIIVATVMMAENITLVALEPLTVYKTPSGEALQSSTGFAEIITAGSRMTVTSCVDVKHYVVPEVRLNDGRVGYVIEGKFNLERKSFAVSFGWPIVINC